jgi:diguanylate cyclase (GGDEF)-like protein
VLRALAHLLRDTLRQTDIIARCGGEEFGALLPGADQEATRTVMDGIRRAFHDVTHTSAFGEFRVTFSCGIASMPPALDATTLVDWADRALYRAKGSGRNQVAILPSEEQRALGTGAQPGKRAGRRAASSTNIRVSRSR